MMTGSLPVALVISVLVRWVACALVHDWLLADDGVTAIGFPRCSMVLAILLILVPMRCRTAPGRHEGGRWRKGALVQGTTGTCQPFG